jgi:hypothetical protein
MKVLKYMFLSAKLIPLINTITNERFMAQWAFIENDAKRQAHQHYPAGQTAVAVAYRVEDSRRRCLGIGTDGWAEGWAEGEGLTLL